jgi:hypothetical protein
MWADSAAAVLGDSCDVGRAVFNTTGVPLLVTRYEDLKADTEGALRRILQFVGRWVFTAQEFGQGKPVCVQGFW